MTASALETSLSAIEGRVDELLAAFEEKDISQADEDIIATQCTGGQHGQSSDQRVESSNSPSK